MVSSLGCHVLTWDPWKTWIIRWKVTPGTTNIQLMTDACVKLIEAKKPKWRTMGASTSLLESSSSRSRSLWLPTLAMIPPAAKSTRFSLLFQSATTAPTASMGGSMEQGMGPPNTREIGPKQLAEWWLVFQTSYFPKNELCESVNPNVFFNFTI